MKYNINTLPHRVERTFVMKSNINTLPQRAARTFFMKSNIKIFTKTSLLGISSSGIMHKYIIKMFNG